jgi:hypothetical protein
MSSNSYLLRMCDLLLRLKAVFVTAICYLSLLLISLIRLYNAQKNGIIIPG